MCCPSRVQDFDDQNFKSIQVDPGSLSQRNITERFFSQFLSFNTPLTKHFSQVILTATHLPAFLCCSQPGAVYKEPPITCYPLHGFLLLILGQKALAIRPVFSWLNKIRTKRYLQINEGPKVQ